MERGSDATRLCSANKHWPVGVYRQPDGLRLCTQHVAKGSGVRGLAGVTSLLAPVDLCLMLLDLVCR